VAVEVDFKGDTTSHEHAHGFYIKEGHLHLTTSQFSTSPLNVAVYAPERWSNAVIIPTEDGNYRE
jgi:hypothetical protein